MQVFTLGYQGLSLDSYAKTLLAANVGIVIDVREVAWSYNRKYIKSVLQSTLKESNIEYVHLRECGNPSANRKTAKTVEECLTRYKEYLNQNQECLAALLKYISIAHESGKPACLTCYEKAPHDCHRKILVDFLSDTTNLTITHLYGEPETKIKTASPQPTFWDTTSLRL